MLAGVVPIDSAQQAADIGTEWRYSAALYRYVSVKTMGNTSRLVTFVLGIAIGAFFLWAAVRNIDTEQVYTALKSANFALALPFLFVLALFYWLKARRWAYLLAPIRPFTDRQLFPPMILGFAGNNVLPIRLGELLRIYLFGHEFQISKVLVLATLVLERVFDAICILLLVSLALVSSGIASDELSTASMTLALATAVAIAAVLVVARPPSVARKVADRILSILPANVAGSVSLKARAVRQGFSTISSPRAVLLVTANSLMQWLLLTGCILLSMQAFGSTANVTAAVVVLGLIVVGISLPGAPGFIGTIEFCFVLGLGLFGVDASQALAIAIFYHVLTFGFVTLAGAAMLPRYRRILATAQDNGAEASSGHG